MSKAIPFKKLSEGNGFLNLATNYILKKENYAAIEKARKPDSDYVHINGATFNVKYAIKYNEPNKSEEERMDAIDDVINSNPGKFEALPDDWMRKHLADATSAVAASKSPVTASSAQSTGAKRVVTIEAIRKKRDQILAESKTSDKAKTQYVNIDTCRAVGVNANSKFLINEATRVCVDQKSVRAAERLAEVVSALTNTTPSQAASAMATSPLQQAVADVEEEGAGIDTDTTERIYEKLVSGKTIFGNSALIIKPNPDVERQPVFTKPVRKPLVIVRANNAVPLDINKVVFDHQGTEFVTDYTIAKPKSVAMAN